MSAGSEGGDSEGEQCTWVLLYCPKDDSHCLVEQKAIMTLDDKISIKDEVLFDFPGQKALLEGIVKGISVDKQKMERLQDKLNSDTKPKRDTSFHEDRPRKAAMKCLERGFRPGMLINKNKPKRCDPQKSATQNKKSTSQSQMSLKPQPAHTSNTKHSGDDAQDLDLNDSDSTSEEEMTEEEVALLKKLAAKAKVNDFAQLRNLTAQEKRPGKVDSVIVRANCNDGSASASNVRTHLSTSKVDNKSIPDQKSDGGKNKEKRNVDGDQTTDSTGNATLNVTHKVDKKNPPHKKSEEEKNGRRKADGDEESSDSIEKSTSDDEVKPPTPKRQRKRRAEPMDIDFIQFDGEHFLWKEDDPKVVKLVADSDVYVKERDLKKVKTLTSCTAMARQLTRAVFTEEARSACSVSGKPSLQRGTDKSERRTRLDPDGVATIIDFIEKRCDKKGYKFIGTTGLKQSIANMLCDGRTRQDSSTNL